MAKRKRKYKPKIACKCLGCGVDFSKRPCEVTDYCGHRCANKAIANKRIYLKGEKHHNWKGGRNKDSSGYVNIYQPYHPNADKRGYVLEHRLITEKHIGRFLDKN